MKRWLTLITEFAPFIVRFLPGGNKLAPLVPIILHGISEAEQIKGATGPDKKQHVLEIVSDAITATNTATGEETLDPDATLAATALVVDAVVATVNVVSGKKATEKPIQVAKAVWGGGMINS